MARHEPRRAETCAGELGMGPVFPNPNGAHRKTPPGEPGSQIGDDAGSEAEDIGNAQGPCALPSSSRMGAGFRPLDFVPGPFLGTVRFPCSRRFCRESGFKMPLWPAVKIRRRPGFPMVGAAIPCTSEQGMSSSLQGNFTDEQGAGSA